MTPDEVRLRLLLLSEQAGQAAEKEGVSTRQKGALREVERELVGLARLVEFGSCGWRVVVEEALSERVEQTEGPSGEGGA